MLRIPPRRPKKEDQPNGKELLILGGAVVVGFPVAMILIGGWINIVLGFFD